MVVYFSEMDSKSENETEKDQAEETTT